MFVSHAGTTWLPNVALGFSKSPLWSLFVEHASRALTCEMWNSLDRAVGTEAVVDWAETCTGCSGQIKPNAAQWDKQEHLGPLTSLLIADFIYHKFSHIWFRPGLCLVPLELPALWFSTSGLKMQQVVKCWPSDFLTFLCWTFWCVYSWFETRHLQTEASYSSLSCILELLIRVLSLVFVWGQFKLILVQMWLRKYMIEFLGLHPGWQVECNNLTKKVNLFSTCK